MFQSIKQTTRRIRLTRPPKPSKQTVNLLLNFSKHRHKCTTPRAITPFTPQNQAFKAHLKKTAPRRTTDKTLIHEAHRSPRQPPASTCAAALARGPSRKKKTARTACISAASWPRAFFPSSLAGRFVSPRREAFNPAARLPSSLGHETVRVARPP